MPDGTESQKKPRTGTKKDAPGDRSPDPQKHLESVVRHIKLVQENCLLLGKRLIEGGDEELGRMLIANGMAHDQSKFLGMEWNYLRDDVEGDIFKLALKQHVTTNSHHPEYWGGIGKMPDLLLAECACDWYARSSEFGTNLRDWVKNEATKKFNFTTNSHVYKRIKKFIDLLLDQPFDTV